MTESRGRSVLSDLESTLGGKGEEGRINDAVDAALCALEQFRVGSSRRERETP